MPKVPYPKQIQTFANQIGILKQRGMAFADEAVAETWLHCVSYYRMSGYWHSLHFSEDELHMYKGSDNSWINQTYCELFARLFVG